jgi:hypothetical protein
VDIRRGFKGGDRLLGKTLRGRRRGIMPALSEGMKSLPVGSSSFKRFAFEE